MYFFTNRMHIAIALITLTIILFSFAMPLMAYAQAQPPGTPTGQQQQPQPKPNSCAGGWFSMDTINPLCWIKNIVVNVSAMIVSLCALILMIAGEPYNLLVNYTIIDFGKWFYNP